MYVFVRFGLRMNRYGAILGGLLYGFAGLRVGHVLDFEVAYTAAWLPLLFYLTYKGLRDRRVLFTALGVLPLLFMLFGGHAGVFAVSFMAVLLFHLYDLFLPGTGASRSRVLFSGATVLLLPLLFVLLLYPGWESVVNTETFSGFADRLRFMREKSILSLILPFTFRPNFGWWYQATYAGVGALVLVPIGYYCRKKEWGFFFVLLPCALLLSYGKHAPLLYLVKLMPLSPGMNEAGALRLLTYLSLAIVAGAGFECFSTSMARGCKRFFMATTRRALYLYALVPLALAYSLYGLIIYYDVELKHKSIDLTNNIMWIAIVAAVILVLFHRRLGGRGRGLSRIFIFIMVIDLFSFWSYFHPANHGWGPSYIVEPPSTVMNKRVERSYGPETLGLYTNAVVLEKSVMGPQGRSVSMGGPYDTFSQGVYCVEFFIKARERTSEEMVVTLRVTSGGGGMEFARREIVGIDFSGEEGFRRFSIDFSLYSSSQLEFPVYFSGITDMWIEKVTITRTDIE
jgi:hypothetical protein